MLRWFVSLLLCFTLGVGALMPPVAARGNHTETLTKSKKVKSKKDKKTATAEKSKSAKKIKKSKKDKKSEQKAKKTKKSDSKHKKKKKGQSDDGSTVSKHGKKSKHKHKKAPPPPPPPPPLEGKGVELLNRPVFTLYGVVGSSEAQQRADFIKERLDLLLKKYAEEPITIQAGVLAGEAQVLVNNQPLVTITQNDLRANGSKQALGLARQWALALKQNIGRNEVQDSYFTYAGLPSNVSIGDEQYSLVRQTVNDYGLFTTDGSQHNNRVIFWREGEVLPRKAVYLLNSRRQFVVYQRLTPPG